MLRRRSCALGLLLLSALSCGGSESASPPASSATTAATTGAPATTGTSPLQSVVPDVVVRDVATGSDVNLRALARPDRPTLYWFWAPH